MRSEQMKRSWTIWNCLGPLAVGLALASDAVAQAPSPRSVALGGMLYDKWWAAVPGLKEPVGDQPLWASQTTNKRKGQDTWRCKECHGWDYRGKDGAYGSGSRRTGFPGVLAAQTRSLDQLKAILRGATNPKHDFSPLLDDGALSSLALFLKHGVTEVGAVIDARTKAPTKGDASRGEQLAAACAVCHGPDGTTLNFGKPDKPEYVGTVAKENPWEFQHKVRFGHPGSKPPMPAGVELGWGLEDVMDILAYARTLPDK